MRETLFGRSYLTKASRSLYFVPDILRCLALSPLAQASVFDLSSFSKPILLHILVQTVVHRLDINIMETTTTKRR
jgi:hypothetical protein